MRNLIWIGIVFLCGMLFSACDAWTIGSHGGLGEGCYTDGTCDGELICCDGSCQTSCQGNGDTDVLEVDEDGSDALADNDEVTDGDLDDEPEIEAEPEVDEDTELELELEEEEEQEEYGDPDENSELDEVETDTSSEEEEDSDQECACSGISTCCPDGCTPAVDGTTCDTDDQCVAGACVDCYDIDGCSDLADDGLECSEPFCDSDHICKNNLSAHKDETCTDDDLTCTDDLCADDGQCEHTLKSGRCLINSSCYQHNQEQDENRCHYCDTSVATDIWTWRDSGDDCDDGTFCNGDDTCNGNGECIHDGNPCPETECNTCQEEAESCFDPEGTACGDGPTACSNQDTCNGVGTCQPNHVENGEGCEFDGVDCTIDTCQDGVCTLGSPDDLYCDFDEDPKTHDACDAIYGCYDAGWAVSFGGEENDFGFKILELQDGGIAITGAYRNLVDVDPGSAVQEESSVGVGDIFISVFDSKGILNWNRVFGGTSSDEGEGIAQLANGDIVVVGNYTETVDFDPNGSTIEHTSNGGNDCFIIAYSLTGEFQWVRVFGGQNSDNCHDVVALSDGGFAVTGYFDFTVDFDPGTGTDEHTANGQSDVFLSVFDENGNHRWAVTFGGAEDDNGRGIVQMEDGGLTVVGGFRETVDFDPSEGNDIHTAQGETDIFISKYNLDAEYQWARTFGSNGPSSIDYASDICQLKDDSVAVTGIFSDSVDFDPGNGVDEHESQGSYDAFITVFEANGNYRWTKTIGGTDSDSGWSIDVTSDGNIIVTGSFWGAVDFDPGEESYIKTSQNSSAVFISSYDPIGNYIETRILGLEYMAFPYSINSLELGGFTIVGTFENSIDFNFGLLENTLTSNGENDIFLLRLNLPPVCGPEEENACSNHGTCDWTSGTGICNCNTGYEGETCDRCAANYEGYPDCTLTNTPGFVSIPAGSFWMGSPDGCPGPEGYPGDCTAELGRDDDETLHFVELTYPFEMSQYETTQYKFENLKGWNPSAFTECRSTCPVETVSWYDALAYANAKSEAAGLVPCYLFADAVCEDETAVGVNYNNCMNATQGGIDTATITLNGVDKPQECEGYRLPTEAEWEYAARAGSNTAFYPSDGNDGTISNTGADPNLDQIAWYSSNALATTHHSGEKEANDNGLYDLNGNVSEWVWDKFCSSYDVGVPLDPYAETCTETSMVLRGGHYNNNSKYCRSADRGADSPENRPSFTGFRLVRTLPVISCDPDPCNGHGTCAEPGEGETRPSCECDDEFDGYWCNRCSEGYFGYPNCQNQVWTDQQTGLEWQINPTGYDEQVAWDFADDYCISLALDGGGWRLPNISELRSLVRECGYLDLGLGGCPIFKESQACGIAIGSECLNFSTCYSEQLCDPVDCTSTQCYRVSVLNGACDLDGWYWSSEADEQAASRAWALNYFRPELENEPKEANRYVRCVRGGP